MKMSDADKPLTFLHTERGAMRSAYVFFALVLIAALAVRVLLGFTFPVPWNDEGDFVAQAFEFSRSGSFFVSALNPDRVVMWMPPGYMLLLAAVFKLFGYSFSAARWVSCLLYIGAYGISIALMRRLLRGPLLLAALLLSLVAFLSPYMLVTANLARMESFYTLLVLCALYATLHGKIVAGLALIVATAVIHFNAVYFLPPYIAFFIWSLAGRRPFSIGKIDYAAVLIAAAILIGYFLFVQANWHGFVEDMRFQFAYKARFPALGGRSGKLLVAAAYTMPLLQLWIWRGFPPAVFLSLYGAGFILLSAYGQNMWYSYADCLGVFLLATSWLTLFSPVATLRCSILVGSMVALCVLGLLYFSFIRSTPQFAPLWPRLELVRREFIASDELDKVSKFIRSAPPGTTFCFGHSGMEQFFYRDLSETGKLWNYAVYSVTQLRPFRRADYRVRCDSALLPQYLFVYDWDGYPRKGADSGCDIIKLTSPE